LIDGSEPPPSARPVATGSIVRSLAVVALLGVAAFAAFGRGAASPTDAQRSDRVERIASAPELTVVAADLAAATLERPEAQSAVGAYVTGTGIVLTVQMQGVTPSNLAAWFGDIAAPFATPVAALPEGEAVVVSLDLLDAPSGGRMLRITPDTITTPTAWQQFAVTGAIIAETGGDAGTAGDAVSPVATTTPVGEEGGDGATTADDTTATVPSDGATTTVAAAGGSLQDDFSGDSSQWKPLSGTWQITDGVYQQVDASGFDLISRFTGAVPASYTLEVRLRATSGPLHAGVIVGQPTPGTREGATMIDLTDNGTYLRWGRYAASGGAYEFVGGAALPEPLDPTQWHTLRVVVKGDTTVVFVDDVQIGDAGPIGAGSVGLVTSQAAVDFDDVRVVPG
jgi:hypothetical protein